MNQLPLSTAMAAVSYSLQPMLDCSLTPAWTSATCMQSLEHKHPIACLPGGTGGSRLTGHAQGVTDRGALFVSETWQKHRSARRGRSSTLMSSWTVCSMPLNGTVVHPPPSLLCRAYPVLHPLCIGIHMHQHTTGTGQPPKHLLLYYFYCSTPATTTNRQLPTSTTGYRLLAFDPPRAPSTMTTQSTPTLETRQRLRQVLARC